MDTLDNILGRCTLRIQAGMVRLIDCCISLNDAVGIMLMRKFVAAAVMHDA